jgi:hypothetical protein
MQWLPKATREPFLSLAAIWDNLGTGILLKNGTKLFGCAFLSSSETKCV